MKEINKGERSENIQNTRPHLFIGTTNISNNSVLHTVLSTNISMLERVASNKITGDTTLLQWLEDTQSGRYKKQVEQIRKVADKKQTQWERNSLPALLPCGKFEVLTDEPVKQSGILCIDIDVDDKEDINIHLNNPDEVSRLKEQLKQDPTIIAFHHSTGGSGLAIYVAVPEMSKHERYLLISTMAVAYRHRYGIEIDPRCSNVNRSRRASYDPGTYIAQEVRKYSLPLRSHFDEFTEADKSRYTYNGTGSPELTPEERTNKLAKLDNLISRIEEKAQTDNTISLFYSDYQNWINLHFELSSLGEGALPYVHRLASLGDKYNRYANDRQFRIALNSRSRENRRSIGSFAHTVKEVFGIIPFELYSLPERNLKTIEDLIFSGDRYDIEKDIKGAYLRPEDLPTYSAWLHKGITGNGLTTSFISDDRHGIRVLLVPYINIVLDKGRTRKGNRVIPAHGDRTIEDICFDIQEDQTEGIFPVIAGTYDSLPKIKRALQHQGIDLKEVSLLIDESHHLTESYSYRAKAINQIIKEKDNFKYYLLGSATPIPLALVPVELRSIKRIKYNFIDIPPVAVRNIKAENKPIRKVISRLIQGFKSNDKKDFHVFVNSKRSMRTIYNALLIRGIKARCVYSKSEAVEGLPNSDITDKAQRINLYTSCAFDGIDIHITDEEYKAGKRAETILLSSGKQKTMQTNILTQLIQVSGRIRLTPEQRQAGERATVMHYYDLSKAKVINKADRAIEIEKDLKDLEQLHGLDSLNRYLKAICPDYIDEAGRINTTPLMNDLLAVYLSALYSTGSDIDSAMQRYGIEILEQVDEVQDEEIDEERTTPKKKFAEVVSSLIEADRKGQLFFAEHRADRERFEKAVGKTFVQAIEIIGSDELEKGKFASWIKRKLIAKSDKSDNEKIFRLLRTRIQEGKFYEGKELTKILKEAYEEIGLQITPKITSFSQYWIDIRKQKGGKYKAFRVGRAVSEDAEILAKIA